MTLRIYTNDACLLHDTSWRAHPDYRAESCFDNVTRANLAALSHPQRVFLGLALLHRYKNSRAGSAMTPLFELLSGLQQPVDLVFMLLSPVGAGAEHLKALAAVSRRLRDRSFAAKLRGAAEYAERATLWTDLGVLLITHYTRILRYIKPEFVHVFVDGKIAEEYLFYDMMLVAIELGVWPPKA